MSAFRVGTYVTHSQRPAWGVGKVFGQSAQHVLVGFRALPEDERFKRLQWREGLLERADVRHDVELDSWKVECDSTCHYLGAIDKPRRALKAAIWTREQAMERFIGTVHGGFGDAWYRSTHRDPRVAQQDAVTALLPPERLRALADSDPRAAGGMILDIFDTRTHPLLNLKSELPKLRQAFEHVDALPAYLVALADLLDAPRPNGATFTAYVEAIERLAAPSSAQVTWPMVTALPFVAQPDRHIFVRPTATRRAAALLGFEMKYNRKPNWTTYERVIGMSQNLLEFIKAKKGIDMFDVEAFITAIAE